MRDGDVYVLARGNLLSLAQNSFVGRGIVAGMDSAGKNFVQIYWVSADDENKRNLVFSAEDDARLKAFPFDASQVANYKSACYDVMAEHNHLYVVSSGDQTETILTHHRADLDFYKAMLTRTYEYDRPNFTPRISSVFSLEGDVYFAEMSVLRKSPIREACERIFYRFEQFLPGLGYYINTYSFIGVLDSPCHRSAESLTYYL